MDEGAADVRRSFAELWADEGAKWSGVAGGVGAGVMLALFLGWLTHGNAFRWIVPALHSSNSRVAFLWYTGPFWIVRIVAEMQARFLRGRLDLFEDEAFSIASIVTLTLGMALLFGSQMAYPAPQATAPVVGFSAWWIAPWLCQIIAVGSGVAIFRRLQDRIP